jgi:hypothetical protein
MRGLPKTGATTVRIDFSRKEIRGTQRQTKGQRHRVPSATARCPQAPQHR